MDARPPIAAPFAVFGVVATVTPAGGAPIETTVVWVGTQRDGEAMGGNTVRDSRWRLVIRRDVVTTLPPGSTILASPPEGGAPKTWTVHRVETEDPATFRAVVAA